MRARKFEINNSKLNTGEIFEATFNILFLVSSSDKTIFGCTTRCIARLQVSLYLQLLQLEKGASASQQAYRSLCLHSRHSSARCVQKIPGFLNSKIPGPCRCIVSCKSTTAGANVGCSGSLSTSSNHQ